MTLSGGIGSLVTPLQRGIRAFKDVHKQSQTRVHQDVHPIYYIGQKIWCMYVRMVRKREIHMYVHKSSRRKNPSSSQILSPSLHGIWEGWWCEMMDCFCFICILCLFFASLIRIHVHGTGWDLVGGLPLLLLLTFICLPACLSVHRPAPYVCLHFEKRVWNICVESMPTRWDNFVRLPVSLLVVVVSVVGIKPADCKQLSNIQFPTSNYKRQKYSASAR